MTRTVISVGTQLDLPGYPVVPAVAAAGLLFTAGVIAICPGSGKVVDGDIAVQTHQVLDNLEAILSAAGCALTDLVFVDVLLREVERDFEAFNAVYTARIAPPPARRTYGAQLALPSLLIELTAVASRPEAVT